MPEFWKIIAGIAAFIVGQAILRFVFEPIKEFNKQRGDTSYLLLARQAQISNALKIDSAIQDDLKEMGAALISTMSQIPFYWVFAGIRIFGLPPRQSVIEAAQELNGIAYPEVSGNRRQSAAAGNVKALQKIARLLKIKTAYGLND